MAHEKFHYRSLEEVTAAAEALNLHLPFAKDTKVLAEPLKVRNLCLV